MLNFPSSPTPTVGQTHPSSPAPGEKFWRWNGVAWDPQAPDLYVAKAGGSVMSGGLGFGSGVASTPTDFSRHIALYGETYGLSITGSRFNHVCDATASHRLMAGSTDCMAVSTVGAKVLSGTLGYGPGNGAAAVSQPTSKTTGVAVHKPSGKIITHGALLGAGAAASFQLVNNTIGADDTVILSFAPGTGGYSSENYQMWNYSEAGIAIITLLNRSGAGLSNQVGIRFQVIAGSST